MGLERAILSRDTNWVRGASMSVNGTRVMPGSRDLSLRSWTYENKRRESTELKGHTEDLGYDLRRAEGL